MYVCIYIYIDIYKYTLYTHTHTYMYIWLHVLSYSTNPILPIWNDLSRNLCLSWPMAVGLILSPPSWNWRFRIKNQCSANVNMINPKHHFSHFFLLLDVNWLMDITITSSFCAAQHHLSFCLGWRLQIGGRFPLFCWWSLQILAWTEIV